MPFLGRRQGRKEEARPKGGVYVADGEGAGEEVLMQKYWGSCCRREGELCDGWRGPAYLLTRTGCFAREGQRRGPGAPTPTEVGTWLYADVGKNRGSGEGKRLKKGKRDGEEVAGGFVSVAETERGEGRGFIGRLSDSVGLDRGKNWARGPLETFKGQEWGGHSTKVRETGTCFVFQYNQERAPSVVYARGGDDVKFTTRGRQGGGSSGVA